MGYLNELRFILLLVLMHFVPQFRALVLMLTLLLDRVLHFLERQSPKICNFADWPDEVWNVRAWGIRSNFVGFNNRPSTIGHDMTGHNTRQHNHAQGIDRLIYNTRSALSLSSSALR